MRSAIVFSLVAGLWASAAPGPKDGKADQPPPVGEWVLELGFFGGKAENHPPGVTWRFAADGRSVVTVPDGRAGGEGTLTTDARKDVAAAPRASNWFGV